MQLKSLYSVQMNGGVPHKIIYVKMYPFWFFSKFIQKVCPSISKKTRCVKLCVKARN